MLNKKKIRWMTEAAIYEKHEGRTDLQRNRYYKGTYIRFNTLKNLIGVTIAYIFAMGLTALGSVETTISQTGDFSLGNLLNGSLRNYIILLVIYAVISVILYTWQYRTSQKRVKRYYRILKIIGKYAREEKR